MNTKDSPAIDTLPAQISKATTSHNFGEHQIRYLRADAVTRLASDMDVRSAVHRELEDLYLQHEIEQLVEGIKTQARRMFLMCVYEGLDMEYLHGMLKEGLIDATIAPDSRPNTPKWNRLWNARWIFEQPVRVKGYTFDTVVQDHEPVPIMFDDERRIGFGSNAGVYRARIDKRYCDIQSLGEDQNDPTKTEFCAVKRSGETDKAVASAGMEFAFAAQIALSPQLKDNLHITRIVHGFSYRGRRYLVSELADKDLGTLLKEERRAVYNMAWLRTQIAGLTQALSHIQDALPGRLGYHGDIHPHNILIFHNESNNLKFTDWGTAGFQDLTDTSASTTVRPYDDLLLLGYTFVQMLIWMQGGPGSLTMSKANNWFTEDPRDVESGMLDPDAKAVLDELKNQSQSWSKVIDVIHDMINGHSENRMKASEALRRFEEVAEQW